jgi:hypothetical protein
MRQYGSAVWLDHGIGLGIARQGDGRARRIAGSIGDLISGAETNLLNGLNAITASVAQIAGFANEISGMIQGEVAALAAAISDMISFSAANAMFHLLGSPCAQTVLGSLATAALLAHLGFDDAVGGTTTPLWPIR